MLKRIRTVLGVLLLSMVAAVFLTPLALAQGGEPGPPVDIDWSGILAYAINTAGTFTAVQLIKGYAPAMPRSVKQILALAGGPVLMMFVQPWISQALGVPIDLSAIAAALGGLASSLTAMAAFDFAKTAGGPAAGGKKK